MKKIKVDNQIELTVILALITSLILIGVLCDSHCFPGGVNEFIQPLLRNLDGILRS
jgi:hypothetical protein